MTSDDDASAGAASAGAASAASQDKASRKRKKKDDDASAGDSSSASREKASRKRKKKKAKKKERKREKKRQKKEKKAANRAKRRAEEDAAGDAPDEASESEDDSYEGWAAVDASGGAELMPPLRASRGAEHERPSHSSPMSFQAAERRAAAAKEAAWRDKMFGAMAADGEDEGWGQSFGQGWDSEEEERGADWYEGVARAHARAAEAARRHAEARAAAERHAKREARRRANPPPTPPGTPPSTPPRPEPPPAPAPRAPPQPDLYALLGVAQDATDRDIVKSYRRLALRYHPDKYDGDRKEAEETMARLNHARDVLCSAADRAKYDRSR